MRAWLITLLLSGCALQGHSPALPIVRSENVGVHGYRYCREAMTRVQVYLREEGVNIMVRPNPDEDYLFEIYCIPVGPLIWISPIEGLARNTKAYVPTSGISALDAKLILHELLHTFRIRHSWRGVMFPFSAFLLAATGASDADMQAVRERRGF